MPAKYCLKCNWESRHLGGLWTQQCKNCIPKLEPVISNCKEALVGRQIANLRRSLSVTQKDLAKALGTSRTTVAQWETGTQGINLTRLYQIAKVLKVEAISLMVPNQFDQ